jgi:large subunit ribosomal protein L25
MATKHVLNVTSRAAKGSNEARRVRAKGMIPAVIYSKNTTPKNVAVPMPEWESLQKFEFNLVSLMEDGVETLVLVKEVQNNFIKGKASHIDFLAVDMTKPITAVVPLHRNHVDPVGCSKGGMLEEYVYEIEVECLPGQLPEAIVADISGIEMGATLRVRDLVLPEGVTAKTNGDVTLFAVIDPAAVKEEAPAEAGANEPEVIGEKEKAERAAAREAAKK